MALDVFSKNGGWPGYPTPTPKAQKEKAVN